MSRHKENNELLTGVLRQAGADALRECPVVRKRLADKIDERLHRVDINQLSLSI